MSAIDTCEVVTIETTSGGVVTNRERLLDCLDDQAVIEEIKLQIDREAALEGILLESDGLQRWGRLFSSETGDPRDYESKYSKPVPLRWRVCD